MARKAKSLDSLPTAERRRVEALRLAIEWNRDGFAEIDDYFPHAESIERFIAAANGGAVDDAPERIGDDDDRGWADDEAYRGQHG